MPSAVLLVISKTDLRRIIKNMPQDNVTVVAPVASRCCGSAGFRHVVLGCLAVFLSLLFIGNRRDAIISVLPESYALCSRGTPAIHTVDDKNTVVQCLVVHGSRILDTGSLDEMLLRWGQKYYPAYDEEMAAAYETPLRVIQLPLGSIVIPGMSGSNGHALEYGSRRILSFEGSGDGSAVVADGVLIQDGAAPYPNKPQTSGCMRIDLEVIYELVPKFNGTAVRPRIEQGQIIRPGPEDVVRLAKLGVIASVQPSHAMLYAQGRLEPPVERIKDLHAFQTIIDAEERVTLGSGSPAEDMNPFAVFHAAITRAAPDDSSLHESERWFREQYLTRVEALRSMTINPAYASFSEKELGSLEPGKIADYVVISQDIMTIAEDEVLDTKVLATVLDGELASGHI